MHLIYCMMTADLDCKVHKHPQIMMRELGITYQHATPQSIGDQWWFWNCDSLPDELPKYLTPMDADPRKFIGSGLSKDDADKIAALAVNNC